MEFLCERGADVNRGQRSSSLHYAACFGRPQVAKVNERARRRVGKKTPLDGHWYKWCLCVCAQTLLRHGANPDLRDEDGKTPLDKARERGHSEVVAILQSPGQFHAWGVSLWTLTAVFAVCLKRFFALTVVKCCP